MTFSIRFRGWTVHPSNTKILVWTIGYITLLTHTHTRLFSFIAWTRIAAHLWGAELRSSPSDSVHGTRSWRPGDQRSQRYDGFVPRVFSGKLADTAQIWPGIAIEHDHRNSWFTHRKMVLFHGSLPEGEPSFSALKLWLWCIRPFQTEPDCGKHDSILLVESHIWTCILCN